MIYLLYISWLFITQAANDCYDGSFETNSLDACVLNCNYDSVKYVDKTELTFDQIFHSCWDVKRASRLGYCSKLADLVWSDNCECPYCKCTDKDAAGSPQLFEPLAQKFCYNCTCDTHKYDTTYDGYVFDCDLTGDIDNAYEWNDFECPMKYCKDDNDDEVDINDAWWADVAEGAKCDKFCYCDAGAETACVTGISNILDSKNPGLVDAFNRRCTITDCLDEPDRLFTSDTGPSCYSCPKCDCGTHTVGDKWWTEYEDDDEPGQTQCVQCECIDTGDTATNYASCGYESVDYVKGTGECPPAIAYKCHSGGTSTDPTGTVITVGTLNEQTCYDGIDLPNNWCQWSAKHSVNTVDGNPTNDEWSVSWGGCDDWIFCAIFGADDECFYSDYSYSYTDCYGSTEVATTTQYLYCCNSADNCNHKDIDISTCIAKPAYGEVFGASTQCNYDNHYGDDDYCSIDRYTEEETTCANVKAELLKNANCQCKMFSGMYKEASSNWKKLFDQQEKAFFSGYGTEWNDALDCNINLRCGLSDGKAYNDKAADNKIYFVAAIFTAIVVMIIY